jgi:hypothetical protein
MMSVIPVSLIVWVIVTLVNVDLNAPEADQIALKR